MADPKSPTPTRARSQCTGGRRNTTRLRRSSSPRRTSRTVGQRALQRALPGVLQRIRGHADLVRALAHDARHERPAVLEVVRRREDQRVLQLRRSPPGQVPEQGSADLRARAGRRRPGDAHLPGAVRPRERVRGAAARLRGTQVRRPRHDSHADGRRAADHDAGVRPPRRDPLGRLRRIQRRGVRHAGCGLGQPRAHLHGRLLPQRQDDRSQGRRRDRRGDGGEGGPEDRQGPGLEALPGEVRLGSAHGGGPRLLRGRGAEEVSPRADRSRPDGRRSAALPDVHERHHRKAEGMPASHRRLPRLRDGHVEVHPGHPSGGHLLVHGGHRLDHRPLVHRLRAARAGRDLGHLRRRAELSGCGTGVADRRTPRRQHLPHLADGDPDAAQGRARRAGEVPLPLQAHDHGRRADRAGGLEVVLRHRRQEARRSSSTPGGRRRTADSCARRSRPWTR